MSQSSEGQARLKPAPLLHHPSLRVIENMHLVSQGDLSRPESDDQNMRGETRDPDYASSRPPLPKQGKRRDQSQQSSTSTGTGRILAERSRRKERQNEDSEDACDNDSFQDLSDSASSASGLSDTERAGASFSSSVHSDLSAGGDEEVGWKAQHDAGSRALTRAHHSHK